MNLVKDLHEKEKYIIVLQNKCYELIDRNLFLLEANTELKKDVIAALQSKRIRNE
jgi:hypothetical protein